MTISGVSGASGTESINYAGALTPDALMIYCQSRLEGIDTQVRAQFAKQQQFRAASSALNALQEKLTHLTQAPLNGIKDDPNFDRFKGDIDNAFKDALAKMPPGAEKDRLALEFDKFTATMGDRDLSKDEATTFAQAVGSISKDTSSSAELDMINLQSFMSQRQQAIQLCTNLMSTQQQSMMAPIQKIGA